MSSQQCELLLSKIAVKHSQRGFDIIASGLGLLVLGPIFCIIGALIKLDSPGPMFFRARRIGHGGDTFHLLKFRTMAVGSDRRGPAITRAQDPRVTRIGVWLRRTKLDELPQLFNVLQGQMSLVGPRPEDPRYVALYNSEQRKILAYRPGITSAASLRFRNEEALLAGDSWESVYLNEIMPAKISADLHYMKHRSLLSDFVLILRTMLAFGR
jgi:lipopolysaccharide/colanic/teichoic acid biosynthesis glycosyltransferase